MKRYLPILLLLVLGGCAAWSQVGGLYTNDSGGYSVDLPAGWMKINKTEHLIITRDGLLLQNIVIKQVDITANKDEAKTKKKKVMMGMLPQEIAEVIIDNISTEPSVLNFEMIEDVPVQISGQPGFRVVYHYKTKDGLRIKSIYYGCLKDKWLYSITYSAAERYYFDKDISTFQGVISSFQIKS